MLRDPSLIPLSHDHQHALGLCVLTTRSLASQTPQQLAANIVQHYDTELRHHFDVEERILFPALLTHLPDLIAALLADHRRIEQIVQSLRNSSNPELIQEFCTLVPQHVRKEESQLFEGAQRLLSREQLDDLGRKLAGKALPGPQS